MSTLQVVTQTSASGTGRAKLRVLMLCAHEPTMDPRVGWEADSLGQHFDVTVLGFNRKDGTKPETESLGSYRIIRLSHEDASPLHYFWRLKDILPLHRRVLLLLAVAVAAPLIAIGGLAVRLVRLLALGTSKAQTPHAQSNSPGDIGSAARSSERLKQLRKSVPARIYFLLNVFRSQFAPATERFWSYVRGTDAPHIVHCNDLDTLLVGVLAQQQFGCRLVYDAHEYYPMSDPHGRWFDIALFSRLERLLIARSDVVMTVNPMLAELMQSAYGLRKIYSLPNAEPWLERQRQPKREGPLAKLAHGRVRFLFQGRFRADDGVEEVIQAWADVDGRKAALFLRGPDSIWRQAAIDHAQRLGLLGNSVFFPVPVSEDMLIEAAMDADVGIVPYKPTCINARFACPNKLSQYLHAGLMVVSNDLPYVKSIVEAARAGVSYRSDSPSSLVEIVHKVVANPEWLQGCQANAVIYARENFNWQVQARDLQQRYAASSAQDDRAV